MAKPATERTTADDTAARRTPRRTSAQTAVAKARETANDAAQRARRAANDAVDTAAQAVDEAPLAAIAGAIAVGAVAAALIPATARELSILGPLGDRARRAFDEAFAAAKTAGVEQLTTQGLTRTALSSGAGTVVGHLITAALEASKAASGTVKRKPATREASAPAKPAARRAKATGGDTGEA